MNSDISAELRQIVAARANHVCEYCLLAEEDAYFRFQVEHIISRKHGGSSEIDNLTLACVFCNLHKGTDIASLIPIRNELVRFYNPRSDRWSEHFALNQTLIESLTAIGQVTIRILQMNHHDRMVEREILKRRGRYPSEGALLLITEH